MKKERGFTLIELLIVVAIIGIIAAIAIPNLLNAVQRGKQKRTMGDMRTTATAVEAYAVDNNEYPHPAAVEGDTGADISNIATYLEPIYIKSLPRADGWSNALNYSVTSSGQDYTIHSDGKNKVQEDAPASAISGTTTLFFNNDIIYSTGSFVQWPDGRQRD